MSFVAPAFLFFFLPLTLAGHTLLPAFARNAFLLCASLLFYAWGEPRLCLWLLGSVGFNTLVAYAIIHSRSPKVWLTYGITTNLLVLAYFKYTGFLLSSLSLSFAGFEVPALPLGISFITFHAISLLIDIARKPDTVRLSEVALYFCLFPQLIAGPITRYHQIIGQVRERTVSLHAMTEGVERFILGLAKKVLLADILGRLTDVAFATPPEQLSAAMAWTGAVAYAMQIYFDFSGYADMAVGLGQMLGFRLPENFHNPYHAVSITDFWRRWHLSLTAWFRDYVYIPLGGNRCGLPRNILNILIVFTLSGIWHGANWTFILWGALYGIILSLEKLCTTIQMPNAKCQHTFTHNLCSIRYSLFAIRSVTHLYTLFVVLCLWVLFRSPSVAWATEYFYSMLFFSTATNVTGDAISWMIFPLAAFLLLPGFDRVYKRLEHLAPHGTHAARHGMMLVLFLLCLTVIAGETYRPFLYFQF